MSSTLPKATSLPPASLAKPHSVSESSQRRSARLQKSVESAEMVESGAEDSPESLGVGSSTALQETSASLPIQEEGIYAGPSTSTFAAQLQPTASELQLVNLKSALEEQCALILAQQEEMRKLREQVSAFTLLSTNFSPPSSSTVAQATDVITPTPATHFAPAQAHPPYPSSYPRPPPVDPSVTFPQPHHPARDLPPHMAASPATQSPVVRHLFAPGVNPAPRTSAPPPRFSPPERPPVPTQPTDSFPSQYPYPFDPRMFDEGDSDVAKLDKFTGKDPRKLRSFVASCIMMFDAKPRKYSSDRQRWNEEA